MFPIVQVSGTPYERGRQYGEQARHRVHRSLAAYDRTYRYFADWDWQRATTEAERYLPAIEEFDDGIAAELAGIAAGAGVNRADILAVNVRTEVMYSAKVARATAGLRPPEECSVFARVSPDGHVVAGQNWDWAPFAADTVVVLQSEPDEGPSFVTVVEAGLLAKFGVNSAGLAVMTNALACTDDVGDPAVPYHVMLRGLLGCGSTSAALDLLGSATRASSANYLLVDESGSAVDVEARPGGAFALHRMLPDGRGVLLHTNHFVAADFPSAEGGVVDYANLIESTSHFRLQRVTETVAAAQDPSDLDVYATALTDHANHPDSVCRHPDATLPDEEQSLTVASVLVDLTARSLRLSAGPPCAHGYTELPVPVLVGQTT